jgi:hypothetical protein
MRRFNACLEHQRQVIKLPGELLELWMLSFGFTIVNELKPTKRRRTKSTRKL